MNKLLNRYFEENFFVIPLRKNSKIPKYKKWTDYSISYLEALAWLKVGGNIGVVSGKQSIKDGYELMIIDIDTRPVYENSSPYAKEEWLNFFRKFNTWIQFTPNGFHILLRVRPYENVYKTQLFLETNNLNPHRTTLDPKHEEMSQLATLGESAFTKKEHDKYFADTIRWSSMYIVVAPSTVNEKSYWWLDDCKGEILRL